MSLIRNSGIVVAGTLISNILAYAFHFYAARILGPEDYGELGALIALFLLLIIPLSILLTGVTKFTAIFYGAKDFVKLSSLRRKVTRDVLIYTGVIFILLILNHDFISNYLRLKNNSHSLIIGVILCFCAIQTVNNGILLGQKKYTIFSISSIIESSSRFLLLIVLLYLGFGYSSGLIAYGFGYLLSAIFIIPYINESYKNRINSDQISLKPLYHYLIKVMIVSIIFQTFLNLPSIFIKHYYSSEITGYWTAALNISKIILFVSSAIGQVMFPELINEIDKNKVKLIFKKSAILMIIFAMIVSLLFLFFGEIFINILYGSSFEKAAEYLKWLGFAMIGFSFLQLYAFYQLAKID